MLVRVRGLLLAALLGGAPAACGPQQPVRGAPDPLPPATITTVPPVVVTPPSAPPPPPVAPADPAARSVPPAEAFKLGLMPLDATRVPAFAQAHPTYDGRGVLIAILDSGIDPSVPGLQKTSDGLAKVLDLRDFSGEGRIALRRIERRGDTLLVGARKLLGASRIAGLAEGGVMWGGALDELALGKAPAADMDGDGTVGDTLPVVVVRSGANWVLFADTQGNGTLADDTPIRDYAVAREAFGWSRTNREPSVHLAANFADSAGAPRLDLFFDTSSHGTHVAGIAAAHDLYGVSGFDGVAPGARLLGLKIANDARGGVTVTRSMAFALDYAIRFAAERKMPLVVNLSFGVGNEREGRARIDAIVDSMLAKHPEVAMAVAASNDGPGLSTVGFPGSATRVVAVGATQPLVFSGVARSDTLHDPMAPFSSRGGELAAPDIAVPGTAYSSVPNFAIGGEQESGTSMATPHVAGLIARLLSGLVAEQRPVDGRRAIQALRASARPVPGASAVDAGAGQPELGTAWAILAGDATLPRVAVDVGSVRGRGAVWFTRDDGTTRRTGDIGTVVTLRGVDAPLRAPLKLRASAPWIHVPATAPIDAGQAKFTVRVDAVGDSAGVLEGGIDVLDGDLRVAVIPVTLRTPLAAAVRVASQHVEVAAGGVARVVIPAEAGRGMQIEVATPTQSGQATASLHEPGGMPFRDGASLPAGSGDGAALFDLGANDVVGGFYELDVVAGPLAGATATVTVRRAPLTLDAKRGADSLRITATSLVGTALSVRMRVGLIGAEQRIAVKRTGSAPVRIKVAVPNWAARLQVDARMPAEQWERVTDVGLTFRDRHGRQFDESPINYAFARAAPELPPGVAGDSIELELAPAFAEQDSAEWSADLVVRFYAERVVGLDDGGSSYRPVAARATTTYAFRGGKLPVDLPSGFSPVVLVLAQEGDDAIWTREVVLPGGVGP